MKNFIMKQSRATMKKIIITIPDDEDLHEEDKIELTKMFKLICDNIGNNGLPCRIDDE